MAVVIIIIMSYTTDLKDELARFDPKKDCCALAELAAMARGQGELALLGGGRVALNISTEHEWCAKRIVSLCRRLFDIAPDISRVSKRQPRPMVVYNILLSHHDILERLDMNPFPAPLGRFTRSSCCVAAALRGTFLACGIISDPAKQYLMEFSLSGEIAAQEVVELLARSGISCSWTERRDKEIIYVKEFESLVNLTGLMEGYSTLLAIENAHVLKDVRNRINRRTNCDAANIDKTVTAAVLQTGDIMYISEKKGLGALSAPLQEAARLRLENSDASLSELADAIGVSRSAINNRLRKIRQIAHDLREQEEEL